jgi:hypothetical protein
MKATQFIKDQGIEKASKLLKRLHELGCPDDMQITVINGMWHRTANGFTYPDLKRLLESVDLVKEHYTVEQATKYANSAYTAPEVKERLTQAIKDYESIYGEGNETI